MHTGMMWLDDSSIALTAKIQKAADYYHKKYGRLPNLCLVHPDTLKDAKLDELTGIIVRPYRPVLPGYVWIGIEEMPTKETEAVK